MARARLISKSLSTSQRFYRVQHVAGKLAEFTQLLYPLLVVHADDFGREEADPASVKFRVLPGSSRTFPEFQQALRHLESVGLITLGDCESGKFLQINDFEKHQAGLHKRTKSNFPEIPGNSRNAREIPSDLDLELDLELKGTDLELKGNDLAPSARAVKAHPPGFSEFWSAYPKRKAKADAEKAWAQMHPPLSAVLSALSWQVTQPGWLKDKGEFIPHPATWLRRRMWEDEPFHPDTNGGRVSSPSELRRAWKDECRELHGSRCGNVEMHAARMAQ